jgi:hypothetical protein
MAKKKDPRLERAGVSGYNKPKRTPSHPTKSHVVVAKEGDKVGNFEFVRTELKGKNKTWLMKCICGKIKRFWKYSTITKQKSCGCGTDKIGYTKEQRRMLNSRFHSYKSGAKKRGFNWELSYEEFGKISRLNCAYCGSEPIIANYFENAPSLQKESPKRDWSKYTIKFNGIDRIDSSAGYTYNNCTPCCCKCNRAKSDMTVEEFKNHIKKIYKWLHQTE